MTPYQNIIKIVSTYKPSMVWDKKEPFTEWQNKARNKLIELTGLEKMVPAEKHVIIEYETQHEDFKEIRFQFQSEPDYYVPCHLLVPNGATKPLPTMICLQGHSRGMHNSLGRTKYGGEEIEGDRDFAIRAVKEGFCAIALEQRYFGETSDNVSTTGKPSCQYPALTNFLIGRTVVAERVWDVGRCIDTIEDVFSEFCNANEVYCMGNSGGGTASFYAGILEPRLKGVIPSCSFSSFSASIGGMPHCACNFIPGLLNYLDMGELMALIAPKKLVIVSGQTDSIFPIEQAKEVFEIGKEGYKALGVDDYCAHVIGPGGHRFYADIAWPVFKEIIKK